MLLGFSQSDGESLTPVPTIYVGSETEHGLLQLVGIL